MTPTIRCLGGETPKPIGWQRRMTTEPNTLVDLYLPIRDEIARVGDIIDNELHSDHPVVSDLCRRLTHYRGKMLRPALVLLSGKATGETTPAHETLAAVVEIVHLATLIHDDVLDESAIRRKHRTFNATDGNEMAVLLGDYLISHAYHLCSSLDDQYAVRAIGATTNTVCEGEIVEIHHRHDCDLTETRYFDIIRGKTASLTATCCMLGARYAGADAEVVSSMQRYGLCSGLAFQIVDDVLDLTGDETQTGKSVGRDMAKGHATLPVIHCLEHGPADIADQVREHLAGNMDLDIRDGLIRSGSIDYAMDVARGYVQSAVNQLDILDDSLARETLTFLAEFILHRQA
jgi:octaprenyl-diphosphate synthase